MAKDETSKRRITLERTYKASLQDVWDMWTTKDGIESWWGPDGFSVSTCATVACAVRPVNGGSPINIADVTQPRA